MRFEFFTSLTIAAVLASEVSSIPLRQTEMDVTDYNNFAQLWSTATTQDTQLAQIVE